nr:elongation factor G [Maliibacterium massiliense]
MKSYQTTQIRNFGIVGHGGEGKTTLAEAILYAAGITDRMGRVEDGSTVTDYDPEEIKRQVSISAAMAPFEYKGYCINAIDVPGYFDFMGETVAALSVSDSAVILVNAVSGVAVGTQKAWHYCKRYGNARLFFVNNMDREHADFDKVLSQLQEQFGASVAPVQMPIMQGEKFAGYVDLIDMKAYLFEGKGTKEVEPPADIAEHAEMLREQLMEAAATNDDALMEKYLDEGALSSEEIIRGLRLGTVDASVVPVLCGAAAPNLGVTALIDSIINFMPSPADRAPAKGVNPKTNEEEERPCSNDAPFSAFVFKTVADPFVGKLSMFKVMSGVLKPDMALYNANREKTEKPGALYVMRGKKQISTPQLVAGDIGAMAKLQYTMTGDTLCDGSKPIRYPELRMPKPAISLAVSAKKQGEEDKVFSGFARLAEEDPSFTISKADTGDTLISGQGELHLEIITAKLKNKFGAEALLSNPIIPYRETIRKTVKAEGRHKKQSGGHGQFGHVWIEFSPLSDGTEFEFVDKVVGGAVPRNFIPAVEKGLREAITKGVLAGYPVTGLRCTLYDGSYHSVDSSEMAFKVAANLAFKKGLAEANPVLLEPIYHAEVIVPDEYMGDVIGDMNRRRGRIMGMDPQGDGTQKIDAEVPLAEMFKYATDLRSMTQAHGSFTMEFVRYEEVPAQSAAKIIEQHKKEMEEE